MYDLKAMKYGIDTPRGELDVHGVYFIWLYTPEGSMYWNDQRKRDTPTPEAQSKLDAMRKQYERERLPAIGVLHKWDGGAKGPLPVGTDNTYWYREKVSRSTEAICDDWNDVTHYLVHSYPSTTTRVTGSLNVTYGKPDFETWEADE